MRYAIIENDLVVNVVVASAQVIAELFPGGNYAAVPDDVNVSIGWSYVGDSVFGVFSPPIIQPEPEVEPIPNWPGFNFYLFSNAEFIQYGLSLQALNPYLVPALVERYGQITKVGLEESDFASYWVYFCQLGQITTAHRQTWADAAEAFDLPAEFVFIIRGS